MTSNDEGGEKNRGVANMITDLCELVDRSSDLMLVGRFKSDLMQLMKFYQGKKDEGNRDRKQLASRQMSPAGDVHDGSKQDYKGTVVHAEDRYTEDKALTLTSGDRKQTSSPTVMEKSGNGVNGGNGDILENLEAPKGQWRALFGSRVINEDGLNLRFIEPVMENNVKITKCLKKEVDIEVEKW